MLKITHLTLKDIGGIRNLSINFGPHMNILCGSNGVGKTTVLDAIAQAFGINSSRLARKHVNASHGHITVATVTESGKGQTEYTSKSFHPLDADLRHGSIDQSKNIIMIRTARDIPYHPLESISRDPKPEANRYYGTLSSGIDYSEIKKWLTNRYLWSAHKTGNTFTQNQNLAISKECFSVLDPTVTFSRVSNSHDIFVVTQKNEIYLEYLSSGYKSALAILLGLIKELEIRFGDDNLLVTNFKGLILIDEIELHLHPEWQAKLVASIKVIFPNAQIIATTHSPHIIQEAIPNEIIPLHFDENKDVHLKLVRSAEYGFQGWTLEEILEDVMGLKRTRSGIYYDSIKSFENAIFSENRELAEKEFAILDKMLHPNNYLRKILSIQMTSVQKK